MKEEPYRDSEAGGRAAEPGPWVELGAACGSIGVGQADLAWPISVEPGQEQRADCERAQHDSDPARPVGSDEQEDCACDGQRERKSTNREYAGEAAPQSRRRMELGMTRTVSARIHAWLAVLREH